MHALPALMIFNTLKPKVWSVQAFRGLAFIFGPSFPFVFGLLGLHFLLYWPFGPSFPSILAFWALISFHVGLLGFHFLSFWPFGPSFPFILAFWAFISFHFGLLGFHFVAFLPSIWPFEAPGGVSLTSSGLRPWGPPHKLPKTVRFPFVPH